MNNKYLFFLTIFFAVSVLGLFFQYERLFAIGGVNPNVALITILLPVFLFGNKNYFLIFSTLFILIASLWGNFWLGKIFLIFGLALLQVLLRKNFTGNNFFDFLLSIAVGTFVFYVVIGIFSPVSFPRFAILFFEMVYNIFIGFIFWSIFSNLFQNKKLISYFFYG